MSNKPKVIVIGAGLGGIAAAVSLAAQGCEVKVFEKNDKIGGKLNFLVKDGFQFDLGPSIIILPHLFRRLFERAGKKMEDYVEFQELPLQWRSFFEDGVTIDLHSDMRIMEKELERLGVDSAGYWSFVEYSRNLYKFTEESYLERGSDSIGEIIRGNGLLKILRGTDLFASMDGGVSRYIKEPHLRHMLNFFIKYVGSSPYDAPALLNLLPYSQLGYGLWYVNGGMYNLARGLNKLMIELGIEINLGREVKRILKRDKRVEGVYLDNGETVIGDYVVSNMEVIPAYRELLDESGGMMLKKYEYLYEPAASGLVVHLGLNRRYPQFAHHNFVFSRDPKKHFDTIHRRKQMPEDPTIYLVCPTRTDPSVAPEGHEIIKLLPHIPYLQNPPFAPEEYMALKERLFDKLERIGCEDLRKHIVTEDVMTPHDIHSRYYSNKGSIYGVVSNRKRNFALKAPKQSEKYDNLYFVGGSVNPGGGTPMVVLSGQIVADRIAKRYR